MAYLEELLPEFRKGAKIRCSDWGNDTYVRLAKDGIIVNNDEKLQVLYTDEILADSWEFYQEPEPDWAYIIKNKCLCYFWNDDEKSKTLKFLTNVHAEVEYRFNGFWPVHGNCTYKHCRPVRRDEVTFYEDRKDEI